MTDKPYEHIVVLIPGIMGSVLQRGERTIWGPSSGATLRAIFSATGSIARDLKLETGESNVRAVGLMPTVHLLPGLWKIDGYDDISRFLQYNLELSPGENFFEFPYDWRLDNRISSALLKQKTDDWLEAWRQTSGNPHAKLVLIAHSMGGLISRHFLEIENGWRDTKALITFGTPYRGSPKAIGGLVNGLGAGPIKLNEMTSTVRGLPSVYQLLPRYPCYDQGDGEIIRIEEASELPNVSIDDAIVGIEFQREIGRAVKKNMCDMSYMSNRYLIFPVVGATQKTVQQAHCVDDRVEMVTDMGDGDYDGDGTVPRVSATPLEIEDEYREFFVGTKHATLQSAPAIQTHLIQVLKNLRSGRRVLDSQGESNVRRHISLDCKDVYLSGEPIIIRARTAGIVDGLFISISEDETDEEVSREPLTRQEDGTFCASVSLDSGFAYRCRVLSGESTDEAADTFFVL